MMKHLIALFAILVVVSACSTTSTDPTEEPPLTVVDVTEEISELPLPDTDTSQGEDDMQSTRQVSGEVVELISDCAFDGNCAYVVETEEGEQVTVIWAEGNSPICQNDPFNGGDTDVQVGDTLDALGRVINADTISGCGDPSYYITKTS